MASAQERRSASTKPGQRPILVAIAGGSGSGKSYLARQLAKFLSPGVAQISIDDFYLDRSHLSALQRSRINFDHPRAIDWPSLLRVLSRLRTGDAAQLPCYDFSTHCRTRETRKLKLKPVIILEGLWPLRRPELRSLFDVKIFIECDSRLRFQRRLKRDLKSRGRSEASIRDQFTKHVEPMHWRFVSSQVRWADIILRNSWGKREIDFIAALLSGMVRARRRASHPT